MKYKFSISNSRFTHTETYDTENIIDYEWLSHYNEEELINTSCILKEVERFGRGKERHVLFGIVANLFQSDNCPPWIQTMPITDHLVCKFERISPLVH